MPHKIPSNTLHVLKIGGEFVTFQYTKVKIPLLKTYFSESKNGEKQNWSWTWHLEKIVELHNEKITGEYRRKTITFKVEIPLCTDE